MDTYSGGGGGGCTRLEVDSNPFASLFLNHVASINRSTFISDADHSIPIGVQLFSCLHPSESYAHLWKFSAHRSDAAPKSLPAFDSLFKAGDTTCRSTSTALLCPFKLPILSYALHLCIPLPFLVFTSSCTLIQCIQRLNSLIEIKFGSIIIHYQCQVVIFNVLIGFKFDTSESTWETAYQWVGFFFLLILWPQIFRGLKVYHPSILFYGLCPISFPWCLNSGEKSRSFKMTVLTQLLCVVSTNPMLWWLLYKKTLTEQYSHWSVHSFIQSIW